MNIGIVSAILSALFFGIYALPRKLSKLPASIYTILTAVGFVIVSVIMYFANIFSTGTDNLNHIELLWSILAGILWATAFTLFIKAIDQIGIVRSNQWKNLQGPVGVLLNLTILGEASKVNPILALVAGVLIFLSAIFFNVNSNNEKHITTKGVVLAVTSGVLFGIVSLINNFVTNSAGVYNQQLIWSVSILISLIVISFIRKEHLSLKEHSKRDIRLAIFSGALYFCASVFMLLAFKNTASSIAFNIIQLNFVLVVIMGIFVFKEINVKLHWKRIILACLTTILGILILSLARG